MKYTIRDVAARAGVSAATVSNVLNGKGNVSPQVREQVLSAAEELGYQTARKPALPSDHIRLIFYRSNGAMVEENYFFLEMMAGIQDECQKNGLELVVSHLDVRQTEAFRDRLYTLQAEKCAGIILLATEMGTADLEPFRYFSSPLVALDNSFQTEEVYCVTINNREAGALAARELVNAGCRSFGYLTSSIPFSNGEERGAGFQEELKVLGYPTEEEMIWKVSPGNATLYDELRKLIRERGRVPEGIFATNDGFAVHCVQALTDEGYRVPEDVSVIGMDDNRICEICNPPLTSLHVYCREMGAAAARLVLSVRKTGFSPVTKMSLGVSMTRRKSVRRGE